MQIGYVGLGAMGGALAPRLLARHAVLGWDLNPAAIEAFVKAGGQAAPSLAEMGRQCEIVVLCLPRSKNVQQAIFGPGGLGEGLTAGKLLIDQTSGTPDDTRQIGARLEALGVALVDAAISGAPHLMAVGKGTVMASGPDAHYERALPVLLDLSPTVVRCGARLGDSQAMKMMNNTMNASSRLGTLELAAMGHKLGLPLAAATEVLTRGMAASSPARSMLPALLAGRPWANFGLPLYLKDLNQGVALGLACGVPMPISSLTRGLLQIGVNTLGDASQLTDTVPLIESMAGTRLLDPVAAPAEAAAPASQATLPTAALRVGCALQGQGSAALRRLAAAHRLQVQAGAAGLPAWLAQTGATVAPDLPALARACDVVVVCADTAEQARDLVLGTGGLASGLTAGQVVIDLTEADPGPVRELAQGLDRLGVPLVEAQCPTGSWNTAGDGFSVFCAGPVQACEAIAPVLDALGSDRVHCGDTGNAQIARILSNVGAACSGVIAHEGAATGLRFGLTPENMCQVWGKSSGWNGALDRVIQALDDAPARQAAPAPPSILRDLRSAALLATECGAPAMIASAVRAILDNQASAFGGTSNAQAVAGVFRQAEMAAVC